MKITFISDTHLKHKQITSSLPGGDLILHAGDLTSMGYKHEIQQFCKWYKELKGYNFKVFIAGNHDMGFEDNPEMTKEILDFYNDLIYLQDSGFGIYDMDRDKTVNIWGSPWQPEFYNWGFNLPRNGPDLGREVVLDSRQYRHPCYPRTTLGSLRCFWLRNQRSWL
jgi:3',5'-cyclic AMP phosphodiesterase CpdA